MGSFDEADDDGLHIRVVDDGDDDDDEEGEGDVITAVASSPLSFVIVEPIAIFLFCFFSLASRGVR